MADQEKQEKTENGKACCSGGKCCGCKALGAVALLVVGGAIGFFAGRHCGKMCAVNAAPAAAPAAPAAPAAK